MIFVLYWNPFFGFHGLVQTVGVTPSGHEAAGEFIDDDHLALFDDVIHVPLEDVLGLQGRMEVVQDLDVPGIVKVVQIQQLLAWATPSSVTSTERAFSSMV